MVDDPHLRPLSTQTNIIFAHYQKELLGIVVLPPPHLQAESATEMEGQIVAAEAAAAPPKRARAPRKPKEAVAAAEPVAAPPGLEEPPSSDQPPRARSRTPRAPRTKAVAAAEPEPEMSPPPPKRTRAPRKPKAAAEPAGSADQMQVLLPVVDGAFLASLSGTLKTLRKQTRDEKIAAMQIA